MSSDCAEGLACAPIPGGSGGGICVTGQFKIAPTAKECQLVECSSASDCCDDTQSAGCADFEARCVAGDQIACANYQKQCACDTGRVTCQSGKCIVGCTTDVECVQGGSGKRCAGGNCVQCTIDGDCQAGRMCISGSCQTMCTGDGDCSGFDRCNGGKCLPSGCQTDRECVASTRNVDARCGTDGKCTVPCETDLECGNPTSFSFFSCIDKQCTYVGCDTDKDCRLFFTGPSDASTLPPKQHAVCRDNGNIGAVKPPH